MRSEQTWETVPDDPDPEEDLGYEMEELTVIESATDSKYIFLPADESQLGDEEFIVAEGDVLCDLTQ